MVDTLGRVWLSPQAVRRWSDLARSEAVHAKLRGLRPDQVSDEFAREEPDGSLTVYVTLPQEEVSMRVEPHEWGWDGPQNH